MKIDSPKETCDEVLDSATEAHGLAVALDDAVFNTGCLADLSQDSSSAICALVKALRRTTEDVLERLEALDSAPSWSPTQGSAINREVVQ